MSKVLSVFVQQSPNQVTEGFFTIDDDELVMTFADGSPVDREKFSHKLQPNDNPRQIAGRLTRQVRRSLLGITEAEEAFGKPLEYPSQGYA